MGSKAFLVVALDFGTTYTGYAYSFKTDYDKSPINVSSQNFTSGSLQSPKVPTSVLFKPDKTFDCFGFEAEEKYCKMSEENEVKAREWFYFERFKMALHKNKTLSRDTVLLDQTKKKEMPALDVFSAAIAFIKDHLMQTLEARAVPFKDSDIKWVLTIPAIWDDNAKNFMREAAEKAGIAGDRLELALEPEAASVYCLEYNKAHQTLSKDVSLLKPGTKFMTVDCGGGTIDISVFELREGFALRHLHRPEGSPDGGTKVDDAFKNFIFELIGFEGTTSINRMEMLALRRTFETTKRSNPSSAKVAIEVPESVRLVLIEGVSKSEKYADKASMIRNRLMVDLDIYKSFFQESATSITKYIQTVLSDKKVGQVDAILLAGGFSESDVIQDAVRKAFSRDRVLVAPSPSAAVVTGAVMLGHNPNTIATRVSAYTYGIEVLGPGIIGFLRPDKLALTRGGFKCTDCFSVHIHKDEEVEVNKLLPFNAYSPLTADQTKADISIYRSSEKDPVFVDDEGCEKIGSVSLPMPDTTGGKDRKILAAMQVGGTELKFIARDETTNTEVTVLCNFLSKAH